MFSTSLFLFSADTSTLCHLRCSGVFHLACPWSSSRNRSLLGFVPACADVSHTLQPLKQQKAPTCLQCNRTCMSVGDIHHRVGEPVQENMHKKKKQAYCWLKDFCTEEYLLCKSMLRLQKFLVLQAVLISPWKVLLWIGMMLLESQVSHLLFKQYITQHQLQTLLFVYVFTLPKSIESHINLTHD